MYGTRHAFDVYQKTKALNEKSIISEYMMVIDGEPDIQYLLKQFPVPIASPEDVIEVPLVGGMKTQTSQVTRYDFRGSIAFQETVAGHVRALFEKMAAERTVSHRPTFNAVIYHGTPDNHTQKWRIIDAMLFGFDPIDADAENRGQLVLYTGQIAYMYFPGIE